MASIIAMLFVLIPDPSFNEYSSDNILIKPIQKKLIKNDQTSNQAATKKLNGNNIELETEYDNGVLKQNIKIKYNSQKNKSPELKPEIVRKDNDNKTESDTITNLETEKYKTQNKSDNIEEIKIGCGIVIME